jgi:hypothetical protein
MKTQQHLHALLACLLGAVLSGTLIDATLNLGDSFHGAITVGDEDVLQFAGIAGELVTISARAEQAHELLPELRLVDLTTGLDVVPTTSSGGRKVKLRKVELPSTGIYEIRITGAQFTIGAYTLKTSEKLTGAVLRPHTKSVVSPDGAAQETEFGAKEGYELSGTILAARKSHAIPFNPTLSGPPVELTGFIQKKGDKFIIQNLPLPDLGTYVLSVENKGLTGVIKTNLKLKPAKVKHKTIVEDD